MVTTMMTSRAYELKIFGRVISNRAIYMVNLALTLLAPEFLNNRITGWTRLRKFVVTKPGLDSDISQPPIFQEQF
jgi:hypothetical protein